MEGAHHPDEVERLRIALWEAAADADTRGTSHVASCDDCFEDVARHRRIRDTFRRWAGAAPPAGSIAFAQEQARSPGAFDWVVASPVTGLAGVRAGAAPELHLVADAAGTFVDVVVDASASAGKLAVAGQASRRDGSPAASLEVTLLVDRLPVAGTTTDEFGEFAFAPFAGAHVGLRVGAGAASSFVELVSAGAGR